MYGRTISLPGLGTAFVCGAKPLRLPPCEFCRRRKGENQCDYQVGGPCRKCKGSGERRMSVQEAQLHAHLVNVTNGEYSAVSAADAERAGAHLEAFTAGIVCYHCSGSGKQNCNRYFCGDRCGIRLSEKEGYCPDHMELAGHKRQIIREDCEWIERSTVSGKCYRGSCKRDVDAGQRALYFPDKQRVMHETCGLEYLRISVVR